MALDSSMSLVSSAIGARRRQQMVSTVSSPKQLRERTGGGSGSLFPTAD